MAYTIKIYSLALENGKFYVGQAIDPKFRFMEHLAGNGAKWTRLHKPLAIRKEELITVENGKQAMLYENWATLQLMAAKGWENVRGGDFLVVEDLLLRERIDHIFDCEAGCIRDFIPKCPYLFGSTDDWLIYVLELQYDRYYIGSCKHLGKALGEHFSGKGIDWTRINPVKRVVEWMAVKADSGKDYQEVKKQIVWEYIDRYGWQNVMGGARPPKC